MIGAWLSDEAEKIRTTARDEVVAYGPVPQASHIIGWRLVGSVHRRVAPCIQDAQAPDGSATLLRVPPQRATPYRAAINDRFDVVHWCRLDPLETALVGGSVIGRVRQAPPYAMRRRGRHSINAAGVKI